MRPSSARLALALLSGLLPAACEVVPPTDSSTAGSGKVPGAPFSENVCFKCALSGCAGAASACSFDALCTAWLRCVSACPTDKSGVAAESDCVRPCGLPVSAEVFYGCIQDYSNGVFLGCEQACLALSATDAGSD